MAKKKWVVRTAMYFSKVVEADTEDEAIEVSPEFPEMIKDMGWDSVDYGDYEAERIRKARS
jgi:hypothetical protein